MTPPGMTHIGKPRELKANAAEHLWHPRASRTAQMGGWLSPLCLGAAAFALMLLLSFAATAQDAPIEIGLDAALSGNAAPSGEAIRRGMELAIDEINGAGGVLGRELAIVASDHRANPVRGLDNLERLAARENLLAVVGGVHTPVVTHQLPMLHEKGVPFVVAWAAGTHLTDNGYSPNYVFRVSIRDAWVAPFLVSHLKRQKYSTPAMLLERTAWGRSNEKAMTAALEQGDFPVPSPVWINRGTKSVAMQVQQIYDSGADVLFFVGSSRELTLVLEEIAIRPKDERIPVVSHWGMTAADFFTRAHHVLDKVELVFPQTFSFDLGATKPKVQAVVEAYQAKWPSSNNEISSPVGVAQGYDATHLIARAIKKAGKPDRKAIRKALTMLNAYQGLIRLYSPAFTEVDRDALDLNDLFMAEYDQVGHIRPLAARTIKADR